MAKRRRKAGSPRRPRVARSSVRASDPTTLWLRGLAAMGDERWEEASAAFERFVAVVSGLRDRHLGYRNLAACHLALERYDDALAALDQASRLVPDDANMVHSRGVILACAGRIAEALAEFERLVRRWPAVAREYETQDTLRHLHRIQNGEASPGSYLIKHLEAQLTANMDTGDWHLVERKARRMIAADPQRPEGHFALGVARAEQERYPEALEAFLVTHALDPDDVPTWINIGQAYVQLSQPEKAIPWLERALNQDAASLGALYQMGQAYRQLGRLEEAADWWRRVLQVDPDHRSAQERLYEIGLGPEPQEPLPPAKRQQMLQMTPIVKARMRHPQVRRVGGVTLTWDGEVGFVLEDDDSAYNYTVYAGGPFRAARISDEDVLVLTGVIKQLLRMVDASNTRDIAVLAYYDEQAIYGYQAGFEGDERVSFDADGHFVVTRVPRFFKVRVDSDLSTPYGDPMQGTLIYLKQRSRSGIMISTLGLGARPPT
jgi:tetratricopeptide (TPR) repeat protein